MLHRQYDSFMACDADYQDAGIVLFGAPFDSTTSNRPGARFGPRAIRQESFGLETYSPWLDKDLIDCTVFDAGDLELPFGDSEQTLALIREQTATILKGGKRPLMLGGEHSLTLGRCRRLWSSIPNCISFTLMPTPICGRNTWECGFPTPVSSAGAGI